MHGTKVNTENADVTSSASKNPLYAIETAATPFALNHTDLGFSDGEAPWTFIKDARGEEFMCVGYEPVLYIIDRFNPRDRTSLLSLSEIHFDLPRGSMMGRETPLAANVAGGQQ